MFCVSEAAERTKESRQHGNLPRHVVPVNKHKRLALIRFCRDLKIEDPGFTALCRKGKV